MNEIPRARPSVDYPSIRFHALIERAADLHGERVALMWGEDRYTFRELDGLSSSFARALLGRGIGPGDRVALWMGNRPEWILAFLGISKAGASAVLISPSWRERELAHALTLTSPALAVVDDAHAELMRSSGAGIDLICCDGEGGGAASFDAVVRAESGARVTSELDPETTELVLPFSSGTTGLPKAVRHTHASIVVAAYQWKMALGMGGQDCLQTFTPLAHILGIANLGAGFASGARHRLFDRFDVAAVLESIQADRVTIGITVAPVALALTNFPELESYDLSSLRFIDWCATPVVPEVARRFTDRTGIPWHTAYGCSEAPILTANPVERPDLWRLDSPGIPVHDVDMKIVDPETGTALGAGETGEIWVRGPNRMIGYLPEDANDAALTEDGWYRTGDLGHMEEAGWLHLTDRLKEMIKVSGFQVSPAEVEAVLLSHEAVLDCAVFGVPDSKRGEAARAAVVRREGSATTEAELIDFVGTQLASYKKPAAIDFVDEIPRTGSGKSLRRALAAPHLSE